MKLPVRQARQVMRALAANDSATERVITVCPTTLKHPFLIRSRADDARSLIGTCIRSEYAAVLPKASPTYIVDAGAYTGDCSALMLTRYPNAKLVALEPQFDAYQLARRNLSHYPNALIRHEALWHAEGVVACNGAGMGATVSDRGSDNVLCSTMARLLSDVHFPRVDLFKCDIEGAEVGVFANGDLSWLHRTRCVLIELHSDEAVRVVHAACAGAGLRYAGQYRSTHVFQRLEQ